MGFLDDLKKSAINKIVDTTGKNIGNALGKAISNSIGNAVNNVANSAAKSNTKPDNSHETPPRPSGAVQPEALRANSANTDAAIDRKFDEILAAEFPDLSVIKNAPPESVGIAAPHPCKPYSYALQRSGKTVAAIMLTPHNRDKNSAFLNARKSALDSKIVFLNFYTHFANERGYVVTRIRNAL